MKRMELAQAGSALERDQAQRVERLEMETKQMELHTKQFEVLTKLANKDDGPKKERSMIRVEPKVY